VRFENVSPTRWRIAKIRGRRPWEWHRAGCVPVVVVPYMGNAPGTSGGDAFHALWPSVPDRTPLRNRVSPLPSITHVDRRRRRIAKNRHHEASGADRRKRAERRWRTLHGFPYLYDRSFVRRGGSGRAVGWTHSQGPFCEFSSGSLALSERQGRNRRLNAWCFAANRA